MLAKRRRAIHQLASVVRSALTLGVPVEIEKAVRTLGGHIQDVESKSFPYEAAVRKTSNNSFEIILQKTSNPRRRIFSIAHEIGHLFLHMGFIIDEKKWHSISEYNDSVMARYGHNEEEFEAHEFAAAFLMPAPEFREIAGRFYDGKYYNIERIAKEFKVSDLAATRRGQWLGLFSWDDHP